MTEFVFETSAWEQVLSGLRPGSQLSAARFLALMEQETEEELEAALEMLDQKDILLDISDLPDSTASGETAVRLRREAQLVKENGLPGALEENDPLRLYLEELAAQPACGDVTLLAQRLLEGEETAREKLMALLLSDVVKSAFEFAGQGVLLLDLIQEGSLSLWQAVMGYDGGDIEKHCHRAVSRALHAAVTRQARENGVGQRLRQAMEDYRAVDERLLSELGRNPTLEEIAQQLHMTAEETAAVAEMLDAARMMSRAKADTQPKPQPEEDQAVEDTAYFQMRQRIAELLENLQETDAKLLSLRFGLEGGMPLSAEETGRQLSLTPEEVVQREAAALAKLRNS